MFGYEFVNLTPEQVERRRVLLDRSAFQAYLGGVLLVFTVAAYRHLSTSHFLFQPRSGSKLTVLLRKTSWMLSATPIPEFGPLHVQLLTFTYTSFLLYLVFQHTENDYMHLTKSFGSVAVSQLPLHYLLSLKSPVISPLTLATGLTHERLNAYHRLFGRVVHSLLATHAILYLRFFAVKNLLAKRVQDRDVRLGLVAFWSLNLLGLLSVPPVRRRVYHAVFYRSHVFLSALLVPVLWWHVPYTRVYVAQTAVVWLANAVLRGWKDSRPVEAVCQLVGSGGEGKLVKITMRLKREEWTTMVTKTRDREEGADEGRGWIPGTHVYIHTSTGSDLVSRKTPFTIADVRNASEGEKADTVEVVLVVRNLGGPTTGLLGRRAGTRATTATTATATAAATITSAQPSDISKLDEEEKDVVTKRQERDRLSLRLEGPYGEAVQYVPTLLRSFSTPPSQASTLTVTTAGGETRAAETRRKVLLVAGGIGATYALPIFLALARVQDRTHSSSPYGRESGARAKELLFVWLVKDEGEVVWADGIVSHHLATKYQHQTKDKSGNDGAVAEKRPVGFDPSQIQIYITRNPSVSTSQRERDRKHEIPWAVINRPREVDVREETSGGRPDLKMLVDRFFSESPSSSSSSGDGVSCPVSVLTCGPPGLSKDLRSAVGRHVLGKGRDVTWFEEQFGFGG